MQRLVDCRLVEHGLEVRVLAVSLLALTLLPHASRAVAAEGPPRLALSIETPEKDAIVGDPGGMGFIAGKAMAHFGELELFDIVLVVDHSASTSAPSGGDIDGDGEVGALVGDDGAFSVFGRFLPITDEDDNVLAAELAAAETLLEQLDPRTTRVGVVGFAGDGDPETYDADVYAPLTTEYDRVRKALAEIRDLGPQGRTNMMAGVRLATIEVMGTESAASTPRSGAHRIILFLTDGRPTLPHEVSVHENRRLAVEAASEAARLGVRIDTFAIGQEALDDPLATIEMARATQGIFTPVLVPHELQSVFEKVTFSEIQTLEVVNRSNGKPATYLTRAADGSYSALVPLDEGINQLEVYARANDGREMRRSIAVQFQGDAAVQPLTPAMRTARNRLLEARLLDLRNRHVEIRTGLDAQTRKILAIEIEEVRRNAARNVEVHASGDAPSN